MSKRAGLIIVLPILAILVGWFIFPSAIPGLEGIWMALGQPDLWERTKALGIFALVVVVLSVRILK